MTLEQVAAAIVSVSMPHPVAIDGVTASGKTTLADELAVLVGRASRSVIRVSVDDFHRPGAERYARGRLSPEGYYLDAFDYPQLRDRLLLPLGPGGTRCHVTAVHEQTTDSPNLTPEERIAPIDAVLLVDGVFLFRPELNHHWDFRIFLDVELAVAYERGILRDQGWIGSLEKSRERYEQRYMPGERLYLEQICPETLADVVIENTAPDHRLFRFLPPL